MQPGSRHRDRRRRYDRRPSDPFVRRLWMSAGVVALMAITFMLLWYAATVFLLFFAGILFAIFLRGLSRLLEEYAHISPGWSLTVVIFGLLGVLALMSWLIAPEVLKQIQQLGQELPRAVTHLQQQLRQYEWGAFLLDQLPSPNELMQQIPKLGILSSTLGFVVHLFVVAFVGLYLAAEPRSYVEGLLSLFPPPKRSRARGVLAATSVTLERWLVGRFILMASNAVVISLALWLMGVPLPLALGLLSGLLNFVPNIGPIIAAVPAILIALMQSGWLGLYVLILFVVYQNIDGYLLTPIVQKHTVDMPPALTIIAQVLLGVLLGALGVLLAVPLFAVVSVWVKILYLEETLGRDVELPRGADERRREEREENRETDSEP